MAESGKGKSLLFISKVVKLGPKTKTFIALLLATTACLKYMGFDVERILNAQEGLAVAKVEFQQSKMELEMRRLEFEMYSGGKTCPVDQEVLGRLGKVEIAVTLLKTDSHPPNK